MRLSLLLLSIATSAFGGSPKQVNMPVGHTTTLSMGAPVSSVRVTDPALVGVRRDGRRVMLVGRSSGRTEVVVKTTDGETHLQVYVAADKYAMP